MYVYTGSHHCRVAVNPLSFTGLHCYPCNLSSTWWLPYVWMHQNVKEAAQPALICGRQPLGGLGFNWPENDMRSAGNDPLISPKLIYSCSFVVIIRRKRGCEYVYAAEIQPPRLDFQGGTQPIKNK